MIASFQEWLCQAFQPVACFVNFCAVLITAIWVVRETRKRISLRRTRHLRKVWGIKDHDVVVVVCSELKNPKKRQNVEPREFIYCLKYGDVDAYFEVIVTLLRLYPKIKLRVLSCGEAESTRIDLAAHHILIGGPDYNGMTERILKKQKTCYQYRSKYVEEASEKFPEEIVLYDTVSKREFCELTDEKDYGYFERIQNPNNPDKQIILIGGCHAIGVTGAMKAFSMADSEHGEIPPMVLKNAKTVSERIHNAREFSILVAVERVDQTIGVPVVTSENIHVPAEKCDLLERQANRTPSQD